MNFVIGLIITILVFNLFFIYSKYKMNKFMKEEIDRKWGKFQSIKNSKVDLKYTKAYFKNTNLGFHIDDITWNDLDMDDIFKAMNNTMTSVGEEILYNILRKPLFNEGELKRRGKLIRFFEENEKISKGIQLKLWKLGKKKKLCISDYFYEEKEEVVNDNNKLKLVLYNILSVTPILFIVLGVFLNNYFFILIFLNILLNMYIHKKTKEKYENRIEDYIYMISLVNCAKEVYKLDYKSINENYTYIDKTLRLLKGLEKSIFVNATNATSEALAFNEIFNLFFLREVRTFERINKILYNNMKDLESIYKYVGEIDSLIAVASFRSATKEYCTPNLTVSKDRAQNKIDFKNIYHPLIEKPIKNSLDINKCLLITGSNASGKSTFLRTIGINSIFAQTIYTVFADEYSSCYFRLFTSMALKDDMFSNESYYMVESKSLKRILDNINEEIPILCFVDEILRGTNTIERISASTEILNHLSKKNCICIAATHDIELTYILENNFYNCHFQEQIKENNIIFDYKLYEGRSTTRNAIKILSVIGYDENIVKRAEDRAKFFIKNNSWEEIN